MTLKYAFLFGLVLYLSKATQFKTNYMDRRFASNPEEQNPNNPEEFNQRLKERNFKSTYNNKNKQRKYRQCKNQRRTIKEKST